MDLNDYFQNISDEELRRHIYLCEYGEKKAMQDLLDDMSEKTDIDKDSLQKRLTNNLLREAARRWMLKM